MSFELAVWYEPEPISRERAERVHHALRSGEPGAAEPRPQVTAFAARLAGAEQVSPGFALVIVEPERADEMSREVFALARECGLVCYDPQRGLVHNLAPLGVYAGMQMHTGDGMIVVDPDLGLVHDVLGTLSPQNPFTALVVFGSHFIQVSPEITGYELEYKNSGRNLMFRTHVPDLEPVRTAFAEYATGERGFLERHDWERV